ncbi:MAG: phosphotransferase [Gammaproteobacteria bacterium]|jgi:aminoglycoside phosphotransferase (APT) family kinase protein|nr:phosphotransferase [Gammaproteobacteria bacterium]
MDGLELDDATLGSYLAESITGFVGPVISKKFSGGQSNPTYLLTADSGDYVLRRKPPGQLLKSAHAVEREYRVMQALASSGVPVPQTFHLCNDESIIGSVFFVMAYIEGQIYWDPSLPELNKVERRDTYQEMCRVLATLHQVDIDTVGLSDYGKPGDYFARQINRWTQQYIASQTESIAAMDAVIDWLPANLPADDGRVALVHGDYRLDNMIFNASESRITALLDWELSTLGHPLADLAYQCMQLRMDPGKHLSGLNGVDRAVLGIPSEQEYVAQYCAQCGLERIDHWPFYLVFSFFRMAAILQGVKKRAIDGNASSDVALEYGALVKPLSAKALGVIRDEA